MNEEMHREIRNWAERITQQHEEKLDLSCRIFCLHKMMTFCAAAYTPGTSQAPQDFISHVIAGLIVRPSEKSLIIQSAPAPAQSSNPPSSVRSQSSPILVRGVDKKASRVLRKRRQEIGLAFRSLG